MAKKLVFLMFLLTRGVMAASEMGRATEVVSPNELRVHFSSGDRVVRLAGLTVPDDAETRRLLQIRLQTLTADRWLLVEQQRDEARVFRTPDGIEINAVLQRATVDSLRWQVAHRDVTYLGELNLPARTNSANAGPRPARSVRAATRPAAGRARKSRK